MLPVEITVLDSEIVNVSVLVLGVGVTAVIDRHSVYVWPPWIGYVRHVVEGTCVALDMLVPLLADDMGVDIVSELTALLPDDTTYVLVLGGVLIVSVVEGGELEEPVSGELEDE